MTIKKANDTIAVTMRIVIWLEKNLEFVLLGIFLAVLTSFSFLNVVLRYVFNQGIPWSDEVCRYAFVLSGFFSVPAWIRHSTGIRLEAFVVLLPKAVQKILGYLISAVMLAFFCVMLYGALDVIEGARRIGQLSPALRLPMVYLYRLVAAAFLLAIVRLVQVTILRIKSDISRKGG